MVYRVEIRPIGSAGDSHAAEVLAQITELGVESVKALGCVKLYFLAGEIDEQTAHKIADDLLIDPVIESYTLGESAAPDGAAVIEVHRQPGVMDPVAKSTEKAAGDMGCPVKWVRTARRFELAGDVTDADKQIIASKLLANEVIEDVYFEAHTPEDLPAQPYQLEIREVNIRDLDEPALEQLSVDGDLFLNLTEMKAIQDYYRSIGREPSDVELETLAQTWSEHCGHKTFRSDVRVTDNSGNLVEEIPNLIKSTVFGVTHELNKSWCISVFEDNAGVIEFDDDHAICFKVETHNHPSAIEPYGGASTGIGGVVRDPMGTGMGAEPVANTDVFCFGPPEMPAADVPKGILHPRRVMRGVVGGVRDYGNRMGIPTVNGAVYFDERYLGNPLVFCGTVGILPRDKCFNYPQSGDAVVVVGGRTGRDGIHGATFSSGELTHEHETKFSHAVQIGNAITEKKTLDTLIQARDAGLYSAITDCGAGGLSSAVGEMGEKLGAEVDLDLVPIKYDGLSYDEIWISEAQERMVLAVPQENIEQILQLFAAEDVEATVIGHYGTEGKMLRLNYGGQLVGELGMEFLHDGLPRPTKEAIWEKIETPSPAIKPRDSYNDVLAKILAAPNVASKEWIIRQYDHEVQGGSVIKPLVGVTNDGPGDAAVIRPVLDSDKGVVISCGMNPLLGELDPYQSALHAIDEAMRNSVAVGGNPERVAILDNFCWGNCNKPDRMGTFVQAAKACYDGAKAYETPFISGKDSLNNEFQTADGKTISILPTLLISAISVIDDANKCVTADAKEPGNFLFLLGRSGAGLGGSHVLKVEGLTSGTDVPVVDLQTNLAVYKAIHQAIKAELIRAAHDLSEGGLAVAVTEMAFAGGCGVELDITAAPQADNPSEATLLFGESAGRLMVEVAPDNYDAFMQIVKDLPLGQIGKVTDTARVVINGQSGTLVDMAIDEAKAAWQGTFDW